VGPPHLSSNEEDDECEEEEEEAEYSATDGEIETLHSLISCWHLLQDKMEVLAILVTPNKRYIFSN
jgi:hypothetical protein